MTGSGGAETIHLHEDFKYNSNNDHFGQLIYAQQTLCDDTLHISTNLLFFTSR